MGSILTMARKEMRHLFFSPIAYTFMIVFVALVTFFFWKDFFEVRQTTMVYFFAIFPWTFPLLIPGITMRAWAEERKQGTLEFLLTSPVQTWHVMLGKFLAGLVLVALCLLLTLWTPITVSTFGALDSGPVWGGYLGGLLMGSTFLAVGMFVGSFTQDQIVSFLVGVIVMYALVFLGHPYVSTEFGANSTFGTFARVISPLTHFESIGRGVVDLRDIFYFVAIAAFFLYLNARVIDLRRWR